MILLLILPVSTLSLNLGPPTSKIFLKSVHSSMSQPSTLGLSNHGICFSHPRGFPHIYLCLQPLLLIAARLVFSKANFFKLNVSKFSKGTEQRRKSREEKKEGDCHFWGLCRCQRLYTLRNLFIQQVTRGLGSFLSHWGHSHEKLYTYSCLHEACIL